MAAAADLKGEWCATPINPHKQRLLAASKQKTLPKEIANKVACKPKAKAKGKAKAAAPKSKANKAKATAKRKKTPYAMAKEEYMQQSLP